MPSGIKKGQIDNRIEDAFHPYKTGFSDEQLYWLGWMASDGCVYLRKNDYNQYCVSLKLKKEDENIIKRFQSFIGSKSIYYTDLDCLTQIYSNYMAEYLIKLGITERKSKTLKVDNRLAQSSMFWRGVFEGDGCVHKDKKGRFYFGIYSGSYQFLQQWCEFIQLSENYIYPVKRDGNYNFCIGKKSEVLKIVQTLYFNSKPKLRLERKWRLIDECWCELDTNYLISQLISLK